MERLTTTLSAHDRVILFCVATATDYGTVGITAHAMQSMAIRGFIAHDRESGACTLTDSGRATLMPSLRTLGLEGNKKTATAMTAGWAESSRPFPRAGSATNIATEAIVPRTIFQS
jgi:hypothetical protein